MTPLNRATCWLTLSALFMGASIGVCIVSKPQWWLFWCGYLCGIAMQDCISQARAWTDDASL